MPKLETIKNVHTALKESHILGTKAESFWSSEISEYLISVKKETLHKPLYALVSISTGNQIQVLWEANHFTLKRRCSWEQDGLLRWEEQEVLAATLQSILPSPTGEKKRKYSRMLVTGQWLFCSHTAVINQPINSSSVPASDRVAESSSPEGQSTSCILSTCDCGTDVRSISRSPRIQETADLYSRRAMHLCCQKLSFKNTVFFLPRLLG